MNRTHEILRDHGTLVHSSLSRSDIRHQPIYTFGLQRSCARPVNRSAATHEGAYLSERRAMA